MVFTRQYEPSMSSRRLMKAIRSPSSRSRSRSTDCFPIISSIRSPLKPVRLHFENVKRDKEAPKPGKRVDFLEDDDDFQKHFGGETWFDDNESTWLSSDSTSPSSFFDEYRFSGILGSHHVFDDRLVFWLSRLQKAQIVTSPIKDRDLKKVEEAENQVSTSIELKDEEEEEEEGRSSLSSRNSSRLSTTRNGIASNDSAALIASLTNQETWEESGHDFSTLSPPSGGPLETQTSISINSSSPESNSEPSTCSNPSQDVSENEDWERCGVSEPDPEPEPIFWPFERKFDCNLEEAMEFLRMSPRKEAMEMAGTDELLPVKSAFTKRKFDPKQRPPRRLLRRSESKTEKPENGKANSKINSNKRPSRLRKGSKNSAKVVPVEDEGYINKEKKKSFGLERIQVPKKKLEKERSMDEESIESIIGLDEFDGHEGVDLELDQNGESFSHFLLISPRWCP